MLELTGLVVGEGGVVAAGTRAGAKGVVCGACAVAAATNVERR
jgi:hypothetical protein